MVGVVLLAVSCSGSGDGGATAAETGNGRLIAVHSGRLADVYGLRELDGRSSIELFLRDVLIGPDIVDERGPSSTKKDPEILYDFLSVDPDTLQPRLLITRTIGSKEFEDAFAALDQNQRTVAAGLFGQDPRALPFSVVPRNGAIRLTFSGDLGIDDDFFVARDPEGRINGFKNTEAVQLLEIVGDPNDPEPRGDFVVIPTRFVVRKHQILLDPVLLGTEGARYQVRNNASGLPESPDQSGANLRIAVALAGPLRIRGLHEPAGPAWIGGNNSAQRSIVRDFRSGNREDNSPFIARGFLREVEPPRLLGEIPMLLEQVEDGGPDRQVITVYKNTHYHELDRGDVLRIVDPATGQLFAATEIVDKPLGDLGQPAVQHVRVTVRRVAGLEGLDPRRLSGFPQSLPERELWLRANAPRLVLVAEFTAGRRHPVSGALYGDDITNFLTFTPEPLPGLDGQPSPPNRNVSPFAGVIVRFTKPIDLATVQPLDTFFIATRNVVDDEVLRREFLVPHNIDPERFDKEKFATPHLVASRVIDEDGSQTGLRLQPVMGLFLNDEMRASPDSETDPNGASARELPYFLHLVSGREGVRDLSGNQIDFQGGAQDSLVVPFTLDTRRFPDGQPFFPDNLVVHVARRFSRADEDEHPSLYRPDEAPLIGTVPGPANLPLADMFGSFELDEGRLRAAETARVRKIVDDMNQIQPVTTPGQQFCPKTVRGNSIRVQRSAALRFGSPLQNPLNPFGCRLQTAWREIDLSLSRTDPIDFNLDVEQMYWAPFSGGVITYDEFDRTSLFLGHSEFRPENCIDQIGSAAFPRSGLTSKFEDNYAHDLDPFTAAKTSSPPPHPAYVDQRLFIDAALAVHEPRGVYRYLPLPRFQAPYFVWRDETVDVQGGNSQEGSDVQNQLRTYEPYLLSPFLGGQGRRFGTNLAPQLGYWDNTQQYDIARTFLADKVTGGGVATIALPLLADFWTYCDDPDLPLGYPFRATGYNGWQVSISVMFNPTPFYRVYSGGFAGSGSIPPKCVDPSLRSWQWASGGFTPNGVLTTNADNTVFWIMTDFLKQRSVVTSGFFDVLDPHRMPPRRPGEGDPRLGPYFPSGSLPLDVLPSFSWSVEPSLERLPPGTAMVPEFRAAGAVDPEPWRAGVLGFDPPPDEVNFPLDPFKAGDAQLRKFDSRPIEGVPRNGWTHLYNRVVTDYTTEIHQLTDPAFLARFATQRDRFRPADVRYVNWRFLMRNNVQASPPVSPSLDSFAVTYRFEKRSR